MKAVALLALVLVVPSVFGDVGGGEDKHEEGPGIGYIGIEPVEEVDEDVLKEFVDRVIEEMYAKAEVDKIRFVIFGLIFVLLYLSYLGRGEVARKLRAAVDWYTLGTVTAIIFIALVIPSGIIITFFYNPSPEKAYYSVEAMTHSGSLAFFRNLHNWSSELFLFLMVLHSARAVFTGSYLGRRRIIWITGAVLLTLSWLSFLAGTFMRADQEALEGFVHMMYALRLVPLGDYVADFFTGELALMKLTVFHIALTTFAILLLTAPHVMMRKVHIHVERRWKRAVAYSSVLTFLLVLQSLYMEAPFIRGLEDGPTISGIEITKPPWPIYFLIAGENVFGATSMVYTTIAVFLPLLIFPFIVERFPAKIRKKSGAILFFSGAMLLLLASYWAAAGEIIPHIFK